MPESHFLLMIIYAFVVSVFFATLWKRVWREQIRLFLQLFLGLAGGGILIAWLMYFLPTGPPVPFP